MARAAWQAVDVTDPQWTAWSSWQNGWSASRWWESTSDQSRHHGDDERWTGQGCGSSTVKQTGAQTHRSKAMSWLGPSRATDIGENAEGDDGHVWVEDSTTATDSSSHATQADSTQAESPQPDNVASPRNQDASLAQYSLDVAPMTNRPPPAAQTQRRHERQLPPAPSELLPSPPVQTPFKAPPVMKAPPPFKAPPVVEPRRVQEDAQSCLLTTYQSSGALPTSVGVAPAQLTATLRSRSSGGSARLLPPPPPPPPQFKAPPMPLSVPARLHDQFEAPACARDGRRKEYSRTVQISKSLTEILRHHAVKLNLPIRRDGYVLASRVLACPVVTKYSLHLNELEGIVAGNDKQRFQLAEFDGQLHIRAVQGHSMPEVDDDLALERIASSDDLPVAVHGTYLEFWGSIRSSGLLAGGPERDRNHVHFAPALPREGGVISGLRNSMEIAIYLDVPKAFARGLPLFRSVNGVILTPGFDGLVPRDLFLKAVNLNNGTELYL